MPHSFRFRLGIFLLLLLGNQQLYAQISLSTAQGGYTFANDTRTYTSIGTSGTVLWSGSDLNEDRLAEIELSTAFQFTFNQLTYRKIGIATNGYLWLGGRAPLASNTTPISNINQSAQDAIISAFGVNLVASQVSGSNPQIRYAFFNASPSDRYTVVEYRDMARQSRETQERINFQIRIYVSSHTTYPNGIEINYGSCATSSTLANGYPQVGLRGATSADYNTRRATSGTNWGSTTAGSASNHNIRYINTQVPASGTLFRWTAPTFSTASTPRFVVNASQSYLQTFENTWETLVANQDIPTSNWKTWPSWSARSWRSSVYSPFSAAGWTTTFGTNTLHTANTTGWARFHSSETQPGMNGWLDLHLNLVATGPKVLKFDWVNPSGTDSLEILLSENGSTSFTRLAKYNTNSQWTTDSIGLTSTSPNVILRIRARGDGGSTDIGLDNVKISMAPTCQGLPNRPQLSAVDVGVCTGTEGTVLALGASSGDAIAYQWESSTDNVTFSDISGATNLHYTLPTTTPSGTYYYRLRTTCTPSGLSSLSDTLTMYVSGLYCTCTPLHIDGGNNAPISISLSGTTLNLTGLPASLPAPHFVDVPPTGSGSASLVPGETYTLSVSTANSTGVSVWIDYNRNQVFEESEWSLVYSSSTTGSIQIELPPQTTSGPMLMRIRSRNATLNGTNACSSLANGATYDFVLTVLPAPPCSGAPDKSRLSVTNRFLCNTSTATLSFQNYTVGSDISYQWQRSTDNVSFADVNGATGVTYTQPAGLPENIYYYRLRVSCPGSGLATFSDTLSLIVDGGYCACSPVHVSSSSYNIRSIGLTGSGLAITGLPASVSAPYYTQIFPEGANTGMVEQGRTYNLDLTTSIEADVVAWIDYNQNGVFESSEYLAVANNIRIIRLPITIPVTAGLGRTLLRLSSVEPSANITASQACNSLTDGSTYDVMLTIVAAPICSASPLKPRLVVGSFGICEGSTTTVSASGYSYGSTLSYQWESSTDNSTFAPISGATEATYQVPTSLTPGAYYYRLITTCIPSGQTSVSDTGQIEVGPRFCYCNPNHSSPGTSLVDTIQILGTTLQVGKLPNQLPSPGYTQIPLSDTGTATLTRGEWYTLRVRTYSSFYVVAWVDWNQNGTFESTEVAEFTPSFTGVSSLQIYAPQTALLGKTKMRIRSSNSNMTAANACTGYTEGATYDFFVTLIAAPSCSGQPNKPKIRVTDPTVCRGVATTLSFEPRTTTPAANISYQWQRSTDNSTFVDIPTATDISYIQPTSLAAGLYYYRSVATCSASGQTQFSDTIKVDVADYYCYCTTIYTSGTVPRTWVLTSISIAGTGLALTSLPNSIEAPYQVSLMPEGSATGTLVRGGYYYVTLTASAFGATSVWIDFNANEAFETNEWFPIYSDNTQGTAMIQIPTNAVLGRTGLRIRFRRGGGSSIPAASSCSFLTDGSGYDLVVTISDPQPCSGQPNRTQISYNSLSTNALCTGSSLALTANGRTFDAGVTFQWQRSTDNINFTNDAGANDYQYSIPSTLPAGLYYYRMVSTCTNSGLTSVSDTLPILLADNLCYCTPVHTGGTSAAASRISIAGTSLNLTGLTTTSATSFYTVTPWKHTAAPQLVIGQNYTITTESSITAASSVWIDYNRNGSFESTEWTPVQFENMSATVTFQVPTSAVAGVTGMRVRSQNNYITGGNACTSFAIGGSYDLYIQLVAAPACAGTPAKPRLSVFDTRICAGTAASLSVQPGTATVANGIVYEWQSSTDNINFSMVSQGPTFTYTVPATTPAGTYYYRMLTICPNSGITTFSDTLSLEFNSRFCYCDAPHSIPTNDSPTGFSFLGTSLQTTGLPARQAPPGHTRISSLSPQTPVLRRGQTYTFTRTSSNSAISSVWIDFDQNAAFDASEWIQVGTSGNLASVSITIPMNAVLGYTGMRIRNRPTGALNGATESCASFTTGGSYTFFVIIEEAFVCNPVALQLSLADGAEVCAGTLLSVTNAASCTGCSFVWNQVEPGPNKVIGVGTASYYVTGTQFGSCISYSDTIQVTGLAPGTWVGSSSLWADPANWCGGTPTDTTNVVLKPTAFRPEITGSAQVGNLSIPTGVELWVRPSGDLSVYKNVSGGGNLYGEAGSTIRFSGTGAQTASLSQAGNLILNNSQGLSLSSPLLVHNSVSLQNGLLNTASSITLGPLCADVVESSTSHLLGRVRIQARSVGTGSLDILGLRIAPGSDDLDTVFVERSNEIATFGSATGIGHIWTIESGNPPVSGRDLSFRWGSWSDNGKSLSLMRIYSRQNPTDGWIPMGLARPALTRSLDVSTTHFSQWTLSDPYNPLPIVLSSFTGQRRGNKVELRWQSLSERNSAYYGIERSKDGISYETIGQVAARGYSSQVTAYQFTDNYEQAQVYYRLRMVDSDGQWEYSSVLQLKEKGTRSEFALHPNPAKQYLVVEHLGQADPQEIYSVSMQDAKGQELSAWQGTAERLNPWLAVQVLRLPVGLYLLHIQTSSGKQTLRFQKED